MSAPERVRTPSAAGGLTALQPPGWKEPRGYANGMMGRGTVLVTGGVIGWDEEERLATGFVAQVEQTFRNIVAILKEGGAGPEHIARLTWYVTDVPAYRASLKEIGAAYRAVMGRHFPAMALIGVKELVEPAALVEIEATAILPDPAPPPAAARPD